MPPAESSLHPDSVRARRRGHVPHISISDDSHHVTEAIGDMYGGDYDYDARRSYIADADDNEYVEAGSRRRHRRSSPTSPDGPLLRSLSGRHASTGSGGGSNGNNNVAWESSGRPRQTSNASSSLEHAAAAAASPTDLSRSSSTDTATQHFPLNDIDYESSPAAVAQELSNLQAIRRMSMNVDMADPDLPSFSSAFAPHSSSPPSPNGAGSDDTALFWVPARLHPELAPKEFKTFVEDRVDLIRRKSSASNGDGKGLSPPTDGLLNRRRSMLSKTIDSPAGFQDGADILDRKRSLTDSRGARSVSGETSLSELETLVNDPAELVGKLSIDSTRQSLEGTEDNDNVLPIVAQSLGSSSLKRSTRTNYRRGSLKKGERVPYSSKRAAGRVGERRASEEAAATSPPPTADDTSYHLGRASTEDWSRSDMAETRESRTGAASQQLPAIQHVASLDDSFTEPDSPTTSSTHRSSQPEPQQQQQQQQQPAQSGAAAAFHSRFASNGRSTVSMPPSYHQPPVPSIVETPPPRDARQSHPPSAVTRPSRPERTSSREYGVQNHQTGSNLGSDRLINHAGTRRRSPQQQTLDDMANNPSMMVGNSMSTDALSFIPTLDEASQSRSDRDRKKDRKDATDSQSSKKSSWGWLLGSDDKSKDKDKDKSGQEEHGAAKKSRTKTKLASIASKSDKAQAEKQAERAHDNTRLDLLHTTSDTPTPRGRESLVLDRESIVIADDRRGSGRKSSEGRKEPGIFASIFGGKKKAERESTSKKGHSPLRGLSPVPSEGRILRPDIDYNWTRFSILEERAIYRMAHIKLANPRRALHSQVLLSNFMYSYLAKVQQMHPQIQIPQFIQQKNSKRQQDSDQSKSPAEQRESQQQAADFSAWQRYQEQQERLGENNKQESGSDYVDDSDASYQQQEDARAAQYHNANSGYNQQWDQGGLQGYDHRRQQAAGDMW